MAGEISDTPEYAEYQHAFHNDKKCREWELIQRIKKAGINYKNYCCISMAYYLIEDRQSKNQSEMNYDSVMTYYKMGDTYGIPIHDGGSSLSKSDIARGAERSYKGCQMDTQRS